MLTFVASMNLGCDREVKPTETEPNNDYMLYATLFHQQAAENIALSYQAFNIAKLMLNNSLRNAALTKKLAVVVDVDETVLDNSPYEARCIIENVNYPMYWKEWCEQASATPIAGSVDLLKYAESVGVEVFYITNRKEKYRAVTISNLNKYNFPFVDNDHLMMRTSESNKEPRRELVEKDHHIVLLIGDNLGDMLYGFDVSNNKSRIEMVDSLKSEFGSRFIMLPNAMYGLWANNLVGDNNDISKAEKIRLLKSGLTSF